MTSTGELIHVVEELGCRFQLDGGRLRLRACGDLQELLLAELRRRREEVRSELERRGRGYRCVNGLTPHDTHEYPWECDPRSCYCYTQFKKPVACAGVPCRWTWPGGNVNRT